MWSPTSLARGCGGEKPPVFIATIQSPRTLEGWQRNRLQAQIIKVVPNAHVVVW